MRETIRSISFLLRSYFVIFRRKKAFPGNRGEGLLCMILQLGLLCLHSLTGLFLKAALLNHIEMNAVNLRGCQPIHISEGHGTTEDNL
jgi:hypothetical protein